MPSFINDIKSIVTGRTNIGLTGIYQNEEYTVDIDIVESWTGTHNNIVSEHPIEKDLNVDQYSNIVDHVNASQPSVGIDCIISKNYNLLKSKKKITEKEKLEILLFWQSTGSVLQLEGYGTPVSVTKKIIKSIANDTLTKLYEPKLNNPSYLGMDTDIIKNIVLGNIIVTRSTDLGNDIKLKLDLKQVKFAIPKTSFKNAVGNTARANNTSQPKQAVSKPVVVKESSTLVKTTKTVKK